MPIEQITIHPPATPKFIPAWVGGDREFDGHGPRVNVYTQIEVRNSNELWARLWMRARETQSDWTEASGSADYLMYRDPQVTSIRRILSDSMSYSSYIDTDHADDVLEMGEFELVNRFVCTGDTGGSEAGTRTGVVAHFNPIMLEVEKVSEPSIKTIRVNPSPRFFPQHVNGDREFDGNGPRVNVSARIDIRNTYEIWAQIWMRARETKSDWTEAVGSMNYMLYRHDRPITAIVSDTYSSLSYLDTNHQEDEFDLSLNDLVSKFVCVGDTGGSEAGTRTSVVVHFNPIQFREAA